MKRKYRMINTEWEVRTYDVWGNADEGYEVNDAYSNGTVSLRLRIQVNNEGTLYQFDSAFPSDRQLKNVFGVSARLDVDGDDVLILVNRARDGYPIGELRLISHVSLSPIRYHARSTIQ